MRISHNEFYEILTQASLQLHRNLKDAYDNGQLEGYLNQIGMAELVPSKEDSYYDTLPEGNIIMIGASSVKTNDIYGIFKTHGLSKDRVELVLDYKEAEKYQYKKMQYNPNYRLVLFGPVPHSTKENSGSSSILAELENEEGYPKVVRLTDSNNQLKITKTNLKNALQKEIKSGYLEIQ